MSDGTSGCSSLVSYAENYQGEMASMAPRRLKLDQARLSVGAASDTVEEPAVWPVFGHTQIVFEKSVSAKIMNKYPCYAVFVSVNIGLHYQMADDM